MYVHMLCKIRLGARAPASKPRASCFSTRLGSILLVILNFRLVLLRSHALEQVRVIEHVSKRFPCAAASVYSRELVQCRREQHTFGNSVFFFASHTHVHAVLQAPGHLVASVRLRQVFMMFVCVQCMYWQFRFGHSPEGLRLQCSSGQHTFGISVFCVSCAHVFAVLQAPGHKDSAVRLRQVFMTCVLGSLMLQWPLE